MAGQATAAQMASSAVPVAGRVVSFLQPGLSGTVTAAIVYKPGDPNSEREARTIEHALAGGLVIGQLTLRPKRVASTNLGDLAGAKVAFVTIGTDYHEVAVATAARSILTISGDPACVQAAQCVVAISSTKRVQIIVSRAATGAAKLKFNSAFLMLIKEM